MSKAISRRNFLMATGAVGVAQVCWLPAAASPLLLPPLLPLLLRPPLLPQTKVWHCLTAPST